LVAETYGKDIVIIPDDKVEIDRSLNSDRFRLATGYAPKPWTDLILDMYNDYLTQGGKMYEDQDAFSAATIWRTA
jgi:nucleoside-diphosphate-sugar epimerase